MKINLQICLVLLLLLTACGPEKTPSLFKKTQKAVALPLTRDKAVISSVNVTADMQVFAGAARFSILLPDATDIIVKKVKVVSENGNKFWVGNVENEPQSAVYFTFSNGILTGKIVVKNRQFRVCNAGDEVYQMAEVDATKLDESADDVVFSSALPAADWNNEACPDAATEISVMVVYTADAERQVGGANAMKSLIDQSVYLSNEAYLNSKINHRIRLVHSAKISYSETGNGKTDVTALQNPSDGKADDVHVLRKLYKADLVVMIAENLNVGGYAYYIPTSIAASSPANGFVVVKRDCSADNLSFAHELGHLMGGRHSDDAAVTPFPYCHGHTDGTWRTIMSRELSAVRMTYFSNPNVKFPSNQLTGIPGISENYKVFNALAPSIAKFSCAL